MTSPEPNREEFLRDFTRAISQLPVRETARRSGWSRSTVSELRLGQRLPNPDQLEHLLTVVGVERAEIDEWQRRLLAIAPAPVVRSLGDTSTIASATGRRFMRGGWQGWPSGVRALFVVVAVAVLVGLGFVAGRVTAPTGPSSGPSAYTATIANTEDLGVDLYTGASREHHKAGALAEGIGVRIVCQDGGGEVITDRVAGRQIDWPVWDKLADGFWVPDIYTSTSKSYTPGLGRTALVSC